MLFRRLYHDRLFQPAYLVACQETKRAIVVDPLRDPIPYLGAALPDGVTTRFVAGPPIHADCLPGAAALANAAGATLLLSGEGAGPAASDRHAFPTARWLRDGDRLQLGKVRLDVIHVPGHTPEHIAFLVTDTAVDDAPMGVLSRDFLFVGDVGRPDLLGRAAGMRGTMGGSAHQLYQSLGRLEPLPDYLQVWPGHGAGSACGKALGAVPQSTLGYERRTNWALAMASEDAFVAEVLTGQPEPPAYFARMKRQNAAGAPELPRASSAPSAAVLHAAAARGALLVDTRSSSDFTAHHVAGSINVPLGNSFLGWAGSVIPPERDIVLVAPVAQRRAAEHAVRELQLIGRDRIVDVLSFEELAEASGDAFASLPSASAADLSRLARDGATVLDVRNRSEWREG